MPDKVGVMRDDIIVTLRPEGSANNVQFSIKKRELHRPDINYLKAGINIMIPTIISIGVSFWDIRFAFIFICVYAIARIQSIIIWLIQFYQRYASEETRLACVFKPSCSEYMVLSILKYGVILGIIKGIDRLKRCHSPNGGVDYP